MIFFRFVGINVREFNIASVYKELHQVATYARSLGIKIYNMSETSVVDEFEKWNEEVSK